MDNAKLYKPQKMKYFLVIDQGTSSTRAILFDEKFVAVNVSQTEFKQFFPKDGWVEHDANEIFDTVVGCIKDVMEKSETTHKEIIAIGITNQRETCLLWDKKGKPLGKAISRDNLNCRRRRRCLAKRRYFESLYACNKRVY